MAPATFSFSEVALAGARRLKLDDHVLRGVYFKVKLQSFDEAKSMARKLPQFLPRDVRVDIIVAKRRLRLLVEKSGDDVIIHHVAAAGQFDL